ncbi:hypothetical protein L1I30_05805 [Gillisia sp. M10.2A]|uniref:Uncharacterized protein n=1 Tax=Gillisia lutea TaxID=2909668 RepID=A0ABS9EE96_9FLAO|nr:hypothetical protein [Gillisia lutea]MCF4101171.1 hypothetical protein [Gillisia lutea]
MLFSLNFTVGYSQLAENNNETIETSGDILLFAMPASALTTMLLLKDKKGTWQFTKGFNLNRAVTFGLSGSQ